MESSKIPSASPFCNLTLRNERDGMSADADGDASLVGFSRCCFSVAWVTSVSIFRSC
ncbi:hypothetical protein FRC0135_00129 [Corynebacterium diphtheriae]|nr:hypothetical protein FRC0135_00129 [Corynebacterium diphtheriae]